MSRRLGPILALIMASLGAALIFTAHSAAAAPSPPPGPIVVTPGDPVGRVGPPQVDIGVRDPGSPGRAGGPGAGGASAGGGSACRWVPAGDVEQFLRRLPAAVSGGPAPGLPGAGGSATVGVGPATRLYQHVCNGVGGQFAWFGPSRAAATVALPSPGELAREALARLRLPVPTPGHSPDLRLADGRAAVLVGEHTWLWTDPSRFAARSRRVQVGPVWALVTARPVALTFDPGTGEAAVSCVGQGTRYVSGRYGPHAASPTCDFQYQRSSAGQPGGVVRAVYGIRWQVGWVGSTGTAAAAGQLPDMTSQTPVALAVAEAQALGTA
jgi:hypothetical protein